MLTGVLTYQVPSKLFCHSQKILFIGSLSVYVLELQPSILLTDIRYAKSFNIFLQFLRMAASVEKKTVTTTFPKNFRSSRPGVFIKIAVLKYSRKLSRKHLWWNVFVCKIQKNIPPQMFSWKFSRIFQNNYFVEHLRVVVSLIRKFFKLNHKSFNAKHV